MQSRPAVDHVVTMTLFSRVSANGSFNRAMFEEKNNIIKMLDGLRKAAALKGSQAPKFVLYVNLIPDWDNESYTSEAYQKIKTDFMREVKRHFGDVAGLEIVDFYPLPDLTDGEKKYLHLLKAGGSNADLMKCHAIMANKTNRHLQIDTNTKVTSYEELYNLTFGKTDLEQQDGLNACLYSDYYVSAHNKVVYTHPDGVIAGKLAKEFPEFCAYYKDDKQHKVSTANRIYGHFFLGVLQRAGLALQGNLAVRDKLYTTANLDCPEYHLTRVVASAVNRSWDLSHKSSGIDALKAIPPIQSGDAAIDFVAFAYLIKKHTTVLSEHAATESQGQKLMTVTNLIKMLSGVSLAYASTDDAAVLAKFMSLSNKDIDHLMMAEFYNHVLLNHPQHIESIALVIPPTARGNVLANRLFGCNVSDLHTNPRQRADATRSTAPLSKAASLSTEDSENEVTQTTHAAPNKPVTAFHKNPGILFPRQIDRTVESAADTKIVHKSKIK